MFIFGTGNIYLKKEERKKTSLLCNCAHNHNISLVNVQNPQLIYYCFLLPCLPINTSLNSLQPISSQGVRWRSGQYKVHQAAAVAKATLLRCRQGQLLPSALCNCGARLQFTQGRHGWSHSTVPKGKVSRDSNTNLVEQVSLKQNPHLPLCHVLYLTF